MPPLEWNACSSKVGIDAKHWLLVAQDLNQHQILPILLTGAPLAPEEQQRQRAWHAPDERQLRW